MTMFQKKSDRTTTPYALTHSVCPECLRLIDASLNVKDGRLFMRKHCPEHGWFECLVFSDAQRYHDQRRFNKPGTRPLHFEREFVGCPDSCGLCPEHQQHTCLGILEITQTCNLRCPVCFADAASAGEPLPLAEVGRMLDRLKRTEGDPEVVQISGGEPSLHPQIFEILRLARDKGFSKVMLNTNGLRLVEDPAFLDQLAETSPSIYLQFDGFEPETYRRLRGRDLSELKLRAVRMLSERQMRVVLVATVVRGVNEHELGALTDFALDQEWVRCLNLQPATLTGRYTEKAGKQPLERLTIPELCELIGAQSRYGLTVDDFFPIPCPDPACSAVTYIHNDGKQVRPIPRLVNIEDYLDYFKNTSVPQLTDQIKTALESLFSMSAVPGEDTSRSFCQACAVEIDWGSLEREITMVGMMHFMDAQNFDLNRARKCCVHEVLPYDGGMVPFCNYNVLRRGRK
jgi:uncharacterized radical SAM superfamily Fe-S cluster-containing enzyme